MPVGAQERGDRIERSLAEHRAEVNELETAIRDVRREFEAAREAGKRDRAGALEDKLAELHASIDRHVAEIRELEVMMERAQERRAPPREQAAEREISPEQAEKSLRAAIKALKQNGQADHAEVVARVLEHVRQLHQSHARQDQPQQADRQRAELEVHRARLHADQARLEAAHAELEAKRHMLEVKRLEIERARGDRPDDRRDDPRDDRRRDRRDDRPDDRRDDPARRVENLEKQIAAMRDAHREQMRRLESQIEELTVAVRRLSERARRAQDGERDR